uniref:DNA sliding clamp PCNA n=1 Tax=Panagrellus redivivus TaxID=6233 RepID=A0A7E4ZTQ1_PANRE
MFEAQLKKAFVFKNIIEAIKDLVEEASFDCEETAISLRAMDSSNIALVFLVMPMEMFDRYHCDVPATLGISLANVYKSLKCAKTDDVFNLRFREQNPDEVHFIFEDPDKCKLQESTLKLIDLSKDSLGIPDTQPDVVLEIASAEFGKTCRDISQFANSMNITACKESVVFSGEGDSGKHSITYKNDNIDVNETNWRTVVTVECTKPVSSSFSMKYLLKFTKADNINDRVRLTLSENKPVRIEYRIHDAGFLRYYLAPNV